MISKRLFKVTILFALMAILGACNQMAPTPPPPQKTKILEEPKDAPSDEQSKRMDASENSTRADATGVTSSQQEGTELGEQDDQQSTKPPIAESASPEELKAYALLSMSDQYAMTKTQLQPEVGETVNLALRQFQQGNLEESQKTINHLIANELYLSSAVFVLAGDIALARAKRSSKNDNDTLAINAILQYEKALQLNPFNAKAANRLAKIMRENGEFERALSLYSQAIDAQPAYANSYRNRAILHDLYLNNKQQAFADYENYQVLLLAQSRQLEADEISLNQAQSKALSKDLKLVKRWLLDLERQIQIELKRQMQSQAKQESQ